MRTIKILMPNLVSQDSKLSETKSIPQGSILGSTLFIHYMNDSSANVQGLDKV